MGIIAHMKMYCSYCIYTKSCVRAHICITWVSLKSCIWIKTIGGYNLEVMLYCLKTATVMWTSNIEQRLMKYWFAEITCNGWKLSLERAYIPGRRKEGGCLCMIGLDSVMYLNLEVKKNFKKVKKKEEENTKRLAVAALIWSLK